MWNDRDVQNLSRDAGAGIVSAMALEKSELPRASTHDDEEFTSVTIIESAAQQTSTKIKRTCRIICDSAD